MANPTPGVHFQVIVKLPMTLPVTRIQATVTRVVFNSKTRLPSNLRQITRECVYLVRRGHFRSRDNDGDRIRHRMSPAGWYHPGSAPSSDAIAVPDTTPRAAQHFQDFIGVARIFSGGPLFFPPKADNLFSVVALKTQAKTTKLSTPAVQISPIHQKLNSCSAWGALTTLPCKFGTQNFFSALGVHVHPVHHRLRLCRISRQVPASCLPE